MVNIKAFEKGHSKALKYGMKAFDEACGGYTSEEKRLACAKGVKKGVEDLIKGMEMWRQKRD